jgi:tellurite resistance protein TerB
MFGVFKKKKLAVQASAARMENRDLMQATVGAMVVTMFSDGNASSDEKTKLQKMLQNNPKLQHFGDELTVTLNRFVTLMEDSPRVGQAQILRELLDVTDPKEREDVFLTAVTMAEAGDGIDEKEMGILKTIAGKYNLRLADYGLE